VSSTLITAKKKEAQKERKEERKERKKEGGKERNACFMCCNK
jgi:hypothetical protein